MIRRPSTDKGININSPPLTLYLLRHRRKIRLGFLALHRGRRTLILFSLNGIAVNVELGTTRPSPDSSGRNTDFSRFPQPRCPRRPFLFWDFQLFLYGLETFEEAWAIDCGMNTQLDLRMILMRRDAGRTTTRIEIHQSNFQALHCSAQNKSLIVLQMDDIISQNKCPSIIPFPSLPPSP